MVRPTKLWVYSVRGGGLNLNLNGIVVQEQLSGEIRFTWIGICCQEEEKEN